MQILAAHPPALLGLGERLLRTSSILADGGTSDDLDGSTLVDQFGYSDRLLAVGNRLGYSSDGGLGLGNGLGLPPGPGSMGEDLARGDPLVRSRELLELGLPLVELPLLYPEPP